MTSPKGGAGRTACLTLAVGGLAFVALAGWLVPWHPVPGGMPDPVPATDVLTQGQIDRAGHFSAWARFWSWSGLAVSLAVACWFGLTRRGRGWIDRVQTRWWMRAWWLVLVLAVLGRLATLPFSIGYRQLALDHGLATASWTAWSIDLVKSEVINVILTGLAITVVIVVARCWSRWWPAIVGTLLAGLVVAGSFLYPVVIEPLFNDFEPLPSGSLRAGIFELADEEGVTVDDVLVADASRRTTTLNAYVSGFGSTRRVVVYDTLVDDLPEEQALSVVAHELAHAENKDVGIGTALGAAGTVFGVGLLGVVLVAMRRRDGTVRLADASAVPVVLALFAVGGLLAQPIQNGISRQIETRADVVALQTTGDPAAFVAMQHRLAEKSLADPTPPAWSQWWFGSHPTVTERVAVATNRPWRG